MKSIVTRRVVRVRAGAGAAGEDEVAVEEPLEIRVAGEALAVTMRTPGADRELAVGFLFAEGVIAGSGDVGSVSHCGRPGTPAYGNAIDVVPGPGVSLAVERVSASRRGTLTTSACGVCGRTSIEDIVARCVRVPAGAPVPAAVVAEAVERLRERQPTFDRTGGLHAAVVFTGAGEVLAAFEDVGRHNAVDKAVGSLVLSGGLGRAALLVVSGRASFEIVQKAAVARVRAVASISAPSSLAVDLAEATGIALAGFVRSGQLTIYANAAGIAV